MTDRDRGELPPFSVLLADDDSTVQQVVRRQVGLLGLPCHSVSSGGEALEVFRPETHRVVLLDWQMPGLDGLEVARRLRLLSDFCYIIIVTGNEGAEAKLQALEAGADAFLSKPVTTADLRAHLRVARRLDDLHSKLQARLQEMEIHNRQLNEQIALREQAEAARDSIRRGARELEVQVAAKVQNSLLVSDKVLDPFLDIVTFNQPSLQVDGDFLDCFRRALGVDFVLGDVMGKGVQAALLGAAVKTQLLRVLADPYASGNIEQVISLLNRRIAPDLVALSSFVTLTYARFDLRERSLELVDAGATKAILFRSGDGSVMELEGPNVPLGFRLYEVYQSTRISLAVGDVLVMYSDGLSESCNEQGEPFGPEGVMAAVLAGPRESAAVVLERILNQQKDSRQATGCQDDTTLMVVRVRDFPPPSLLARAEIECPNSLEQLEQLRCFVLQRVEQASGRELGEVWLYELQLAVTELASNVVRHALLGKEEEAFRLVLHVMEEQVLVRVYHHGLPCPEELLVSPVLEAPAEGGMGLYLLASVTDGLRQGSDDPGVTWIEFFKAFVATEGELAD